MESSMVFYIGSALIVLVKMEKVTNSLVYIFFIGFLAKYVEALTDAQKGQLQSTLISTGIQCIKDYPLSLSDMKSFSNKVIPNGENAKCFAACMFKKVGYMDGMGKLTPAGALGSAKKVFKNDEQSLKKAEEIMELCAAVNEENTADGDKGCDRAKLAFECFIQNASKNGFNLNF